MNTTQQPEALVFADDRPPSTSDDLYQWAIDAEDLIRAQYARIAEMEDVADMAIKRIAELEKDAARLLYATKDYDGFVHVERDKYDFILECMEEAGRSEPTDEDELNGVRRLIDAAIAAQAKKGRKKK